MWSSKQSNSLTSRGMPTVGERELQGELATGHRQPDDQEQGAGERGEEGGEHQKSVSQHPYLLVPEDTRGGVQIVCVCPPDFSRSSKDKRAPWHEDFKRNRRKILRNLHLLHPALRQSLSLCKDHLNSITLADFNCYSGEAIDLDSFCGNFISECEKTEETLMNTWLNDIVAIFNGLEPSASLKGAAARRKCYNFLFFLFFWLNLTVMHICHVTLKEIVSCASTSAPPSCCPSSCATCSCAAWTASWAFSPTAGGSPGSSWSWCSGRRRGPGTATTGSHSRPPWRRWWT